MAYKKSDSYQNISVELLDETALSIMLCMSPSTIRSLVETGLLPKPFYIFTGKSVRKNSLKRWHRAEIITAIQQFGEKTESDNDNPSDIQMDLEFNAAKAKAESWKKANG